VKVLRVLSGSAESTKKLGAEIGKRLSGGEVLLLKGPLGAGKTTLVQGIAAGLGIVGPVQSPSFVLERIHRGRLRLRHLDFYRLTAAEVEDAGLIDDLSEDDVAVIEWADRVSRVPGATLEIRLSFVPCSEETREIVLECVDERWKQKVDDAIRESGVRYR